MPLFYTSLTRSLIEKFGLSYDNCWTSCSLALSLQRPSRAFAPTPRLLRQYHISLLRNNTFTLGYSYVLSYNGSHLPLRNYDFSLLTLTSAQLSASQLISLHLHPGFLLISQHDKLVPCCCHQQHHLATAFSVASRG